jgi:hypothetical protein
MTKLLLGARQREWGSVLLLVMLALFSGCAQAAAESGRYLGTHHDPWIPNFADAANAGGPILVSTQDGPWSSSATWGGVVPSAPHVVVIRHAVTFDTKAEVFDVLVSTGGTLTFKPDISTSLTVGTLQVMPRGTLTIGTQEAPVTGTADVVFTDRALNTTADPGQYGNGLVILGKAVSFGQPKASFIRLSKEPLAGTSTIALSQPATGWRKGERLILPDTRQLRDNERGAAYVPQWEELTLADVSGDGLTLTLTKPLQFDHKGARDADGTLKFLPHVGNLSRTVTFRSANPKGVRGHVMATDHADVHLQFTRFADLGRTLLDAIDDTTYSFGSTAAHVGKNVRGRYPLHLHHLSGPVRSSSAPPPDGYQCHLVGNAVDGGSTAYPQKWGLVVHDTFYCLVQQNVVYNVNGGGIVLEAGTEGFNVIDGNFVMRVFGIGGRTDANPDFTVVMGGRGIWSRGPLNRIRNNVVANVIPPLAPGSYAYEIFQNYVGSVPMPKYPGFDPTSLLSQHTHVDGNAQPLLEFADNEAYGAMESGMTMWWLGTFGNSGRRATGTTVIKNLTVWHTYLYGFWNYEMSDVLFDGFTVRGDGSHPTVIGMFMIDYVANRVVIRNPDIQGAHIGLVPATYFPYEPLLTIDGGILRNQLNIVVHHMYNCCTVAEGPRQVFINNVKFGTLGQFPLSNISVTYPSQEEFTSRLMDLTVHSEVIVRNYNQQRGADFKIYAKAQAPSFIAPQAVEGRHTGAPEAGLTNAQAWAKHKVAVFGEVAPCTDSTSHPEIAGFACPIPTGTLNLPAASDADQRSAVPGR